MFHNDDARVSGRAPAFVFFFGAREKVWEPKKFDMIYL